MATGRWQEEQGTTTISQTMAMRLHLEVMSLAISRGSDAASVLVPSGTGPYIYIQLGAKEKHTLFVPSDPILSNLIVFTELKHRHDGQERIRRTQRNSTRGSSYP